MTGARRTKIVATIGPASQKEEIIEAMVRAGLDVVRLNFSHDRREDHGRAIERVRSVARKLDKPLTILQDLQGPKIRIGELPEGGVDLEEGQQVILAPSHTPADKGAIPFNFVELPAYVRAGSRILLDDGQLELAVLKVAGNKIQAQVVLGGLLESKKGINLPGAELDIPSFTKKDQADLAFGLEHGVDAVAMSFVRTAEDVLRVKQAIEHGALGVRRPPVIAKLERPEALRNLTEIVQAADGVMVARGDLGVEMPPESVPSRLSKRPIAMRSS